MFMQVFVIPFLLGLKFNLFVAVVATKKTVFPISFYAPFILGAPEGRGRINVIAPQKHLSVFRPCICFELMLIFPNSQLVVCPKLFGQCQLVVQVEMLSSIAAFWVLFGIFGPKPVILVHLPKRMLRHGIRAEFILLGVNSSCFTYAVFCDQEVRQELIPFIVRLVMRENIKPIRNHIPISAIAGDPLLVCHHMPEVSPYVPVRCYIATVAHISIETSKTG